MAPASASSSAAPWRAALAGLVVATAGPFGASAVGLRRAAPSAAVAEPHAASAALQPGSQVLLCGLTRHTGLNGHPARVLRHDDGAALAGGGNYSVRLQGKSRATVGAEHLVAVAEGGAVRCPGDASNATSHPLLAANASMTAEAAALHAAGAGSVFHEGCSEACDACFVDHLMDCVAVCFKGCQQYCKNVNTMPGCANEEMWSAMPGDPPSCTWDDNKETSCKRYRYCASESFDGCPEAYLY